MVYDLTVTEEPAWEPVTTDEAKSHLNVDHVDHDSLISSYLSAARQVVEHTLCRAVARQELRMSFAGLSQGTLLARPPILSIESVEYYDEDNASQTVSAADYYLAGGRLMFLETPLPSTYARPDAVRVTYYAGWASRDDVPATIKQAILLLVGDYYAHRESRVVGTISSQIPNHVEALLDTWRYWRGFQ
jgi:uncharacterized phiE125 gp8 family phage protein